MRHQNKGFKLGRTHAHREATLASLSTALIRHKHITTTLAKAKALRMYVEPIINRAKDDTTHNRRMVFADLQDKQAVTELFTGIGPKIGDRPGGYTRIVKLGQRAGDSAEMALIELVDYNDVRPGGEAGSRRRRTRRSSGKKVAGAVASAKAAVTEVAAKVEEAAEAVADKVEAVAEAVEDKVEAVIDAVEDKVEAVAEAVEDKVEDIVDAVKGSDEAPGETDASPEGEGDKKD